MSSHQRPTDREENAYLREENARLGEILRASHDTYDSLSRAYALLNQTNITQMEEISKLHRELEDARRENAHRSRSHGNWFSGAKWRGQPEVAANADSGQKPRKRPRLELEKDKAVSSLDMLCGQGNTLRK
ncbi:hypothetical protein K432DRAFT_390378 [Lepidopterella palustris CBS 459.81]|uniref:Uncharacterized protein n=1 Tax=Lepidopterella palustris CBS 459.81 TaxID=1314670 RepID=A0A8E2EH58_9PEZI|nr:hypothetical protein K432DRAFT_390378 [Lepidopterella palustris CBS 459.81]